MSKHTVKILNTENVTHDVKRFTLEKPDGYTFEPGQATEVSIPDREEELSKGPFTFTSLNSEPELEFTIKIYSDKDGLTKELDKLNAGDSLIINDVFGSITYQGPGVFIAAGAGVTPFIAIFRQLADEDNIIGNSLIFSNKTEKDIILKEEFEKLMGEKFINLITEEKSDKYFNQRIDKELIKNLVPDFNQHFYICGPEQFVADVKDMLNQLNVSDELIVIEE